MQVINSIILFAGLLTSVYASSACIGDQNSKNPARTVYVVPQISASQLYVRWSAVLEKVGMTSGECFDLRIMQSIPDFERELIEGSPDFAFMNPYHEVMAYKAKGYLPLLADGKNKLDGIIVVKRKSQISSIEELHGAKMAFPAPNAFAASLLVRATLAKQGIDIEPVYVKSHNNVFRSVIAGDVIAGGAVNNTLQRESLEIKNEIRTLFVTSGYMPHPFSVHPRITEIERERIIQGFMRLGRSEQGRRLLDEIQMPEPILVNYSHDYKPLDRLGLERFVVKNAN